MTNQGKEYIFQVGFHGAEFRYTGKKWIAYGIIILIDIQLANYGGSWIALLVTRTLETQGRIGVKVAQELGKEGLAPSTQPIFNAEPAGQSPDILGRELPEGQNAEDFYKAAKASLKSVPKSKKK